jgi:enoyl-CoA hydratase
MRIDSTHGISLLSMAAGRANAMNEAFLDGLDRLVRRAHPEPLVITGYENFFSAGLDLPTLISYDRPRMKLLMDRFHDVMARLFAYPAPVVAAINGHAIAGGCVLAMMADVRLMAAGSARIGINEVAIGVGLPSIVIETFRAQLRPDVFPGLCLSGSLLTPDQALSAGLVHELIEPAKLKDAAVARAANLASPACAQVKAELRAPALAAMEGSHARVLEAWLDTWFSEATRRKLEAAVASLKKK